jgi:hypothetical protein
MAKLQMIEECESFLPKFIFKNDNLFPRFIIHRRELNQNEQVEVDSHDVLIKQIQFNFKKNALLFKNPLAEHQSAFKSFMETNRTQFFDFSDKIMNEVTQMKEEFTQMTEKISKVDELFKDDGKLQKILDALEKLDNKQPA